MPDWSTAEWAQVVASVAAGIAAIAACVAASISLAQQRRSRRPNMSAGVLRDPSGRLGASFFNGGPGIAVQVSYMLVCGGMKMFGLVNAGHLGVGERSALEFDIYAKGDERASLIWSCTDVEWNVYIWSIDWKSRRFSRRRRLRRKNHSLAGQFALLYPDVPIPK